MSAAVWRSACRAHSTPGLAPLACQTMPKGPGSEVNASGSRATSPRAASPFARPRETTDNMLEPASMLRLLAIAELSIHAGGGARPAAINVSSMQRRNAVPAGGSSQGWPEASRQLGALSSAKGWSGAQMTECKSLKSTSQPCLPRKPCRAGARRGCRVGGAESAATAWRQCLRAGPPAASAIASSFEARLSAPRTSQRRVGSRGSPCQLGQPVTHPARTSCVPRRPACVGTGTAPGRRRPWP